MNPLFLLFIFIAACKSQTGEGDDPIDAGSPDSLPNNVEEDAGVDAGLPERKGSIERAITFNGAEIVDMVATDQLGALINGRENSNGEKEYSRIKTCPFVSDLKPLECDDLAVFNEEVISKNGLIKIDPNEINPVALNAIDDQYFLMTFTASAGEFVGYLLVDQNSGAITDQDVFNPILSIGNDDLEISIAPLYVARSFEGSLLISSRSEKPSGDGEEFSIGPIQQFNWDEDEEGVISNNGELRLNIRPLSSGTSPTVFFQGDLEENEGVYLLNNGHIEKGKPKGSSIDWVHVGDEGELVAEQEFELGNNAFEPFKRPITDPDERMMLLASIPYGSESARLFVSDPGLSRGVNLGDDRIRSAVWYTDGEIDKAFLSTESLQ